MHAGAGGGDGLAVGVVDEVADREHAGEVRAGGARRSVTHVALLVDFDLAATSSERGMWPIATKAPPTSISSVSPVSALRSRTLRELAVVAGDELLGDVRRLEG